MQTRATTGKLPIAKSSTESTPNSIVKSATASTIVNANHGGPKSGNEEFNKEKAEQDLRLQRAALNQKRAIEMQKSRGGKCGIWCEKLKSRKKRHTF